MIKLSNIKLPLDTDFSNLNLLCAGAAGIDAEQVHSARLARRSLDARRKGSLHYICSFTFCCRDEAAVLKRCPSAAPCVPYSYTPKPILRDMSRPSPVIAGFGPAGMFCALTLARAGLKPIVLERGRAVEQRVKDVKDFWQTGRLNTRSNVQFGEGGAGTFSDGKLTTGIKDPRCHLVLEDMVRHGAPEEILYDAKPHVGTDRLTGMVKSIRKEIIQLGGKVLFEHCLTGLKLEQGVLRCITAMSPDGEKQLECDTLVLALGHSARDTFAMLYETGLPMEQKPFSVGVRIEHPQSFIDRAQYGDLSQYGPFTGRNIFPAADYKLSVHLPQGGCYTFCMCPGGQVVAAASEEGQVVTNGMSLYARQGENANSALLVGVDGKDFGCTHPLAGVEFQRRLERAAFEAGGGGYRAPAQLVADFMAGQPSKALGRVCPSYQPGVTLCALHAVLPKRVAAVIAKALEPMDRKLHGFALPDALLTGVETRSSSPVRMVRGEDGQSPFLGVYPCGEGAGYAGGILSAAVDGIRTAEAILLDGQEQKKQ